MSQLRVLVVGASIAGPMVAYWLAKAGASVTVIERFPTLRIAGQAIDIRLIGVHIMRKIQGMEESVRAKRPPIEALSFVREDGRPYGVIRQSGNADQQSLLSEYEIYRGDLAKILFDLSKDHERVKYVFDEQIASIQQRGNEESGPLKVEFMNGKTSEEYDLVVACDGATSRTRAMGFQCGVRDYVEPVNSWAAFFSIKEDLLNGSKTGQAHSAVGGRFFALGSDATTGGTRVTVMAINPRSHRDATLPFREAMKQGEEATKRYIAQHYKGVGWKVNKAMQGMMESTDFYANEMIQLKLPRLHKGRFVVVGDAAYAPGPTGTGTTLALTGAYVFAGEIARHKGDLAAGLQGYEDRMRPIIDDMQKVPPFVFTFVAPQTAWGLWIRNHLFALLSWSNVVEYAQRFLGGAFSSSTEDKYKLPDYEWDR